MLLGTEIQEPLLFTYLLMANHFYYLLLDSLETLMSSNVEFLDLYKYSFFFFFFRATPTTYGSSQARGAASELQLPAYTTVTATWDLIHVCNLHHSSGQRKILNPLSEARDQTRVVMDMSWVHYR